MTQLNHLLQRLCDAEIDFVIVGGFAGILHGSSLVTRDLDVCAVLTGENGANGRMFELLDPLHTDNVTVSGSGLGTITSDPAHVAYLPALGALSFEGIALYPNGVMYFGDENRPGNGNPGGAYFKFIPTAPWVAGDPAIANLASSPLTSGNLYGMRVGKRSGNTDYGQGNEFGRGVWVPIAGAAPINLRAAATTLKLTSYYRPEDLDIDLKALATGKVRFCGNPIQHRMW